MLQRLKDVLPRETWDMYPEYYHTEALLEYRESLEARKHGDYKLEREKLGWAWQAIREDELAARVMGINTTVAKLQAFATGAALAGVGGAFLASWQRSVFPDNFLFTESINILAMVILGGVGNLLGVVIVLSIFFLPGGLLKLRWPWSHERRLDVASRRT